MKSIGIFFLSLIPILAGFFRGAGLEKNEKAKDALIHFLEEIRFQIFNFNRTQIEIYENYEDKMLEEAGFLPYLREETEREPWGALKRAMEDYLESVSFSPRSQEMLFSFSARFGMCSKSAQLSDLEKTLLCLHEERKKEAEMMKNRAKIARMTGLTAGLGIFILLI